MRVRCNNPTFSLLVVCICAVEMNECCWFVLREPLKLASAPQSDLFAAQIKFARRPLEKAAMQQTTLTVAATSQGSRWPPSMVVIGCKLIADRAAGGQAGATPTGGCCRSPVASSSFANDC